MIENKYINIIVIGFFFIFITLPLCETVFDFLPPFQFNENRKPASKPEFRLDKTLSSFPGEFDAYYKDNFGFRRQLISIQSYLLVKFFNESPNSKVILGENDWFYYAGEDESFNHYRPSIPENKMEKIFTALNRRRKVFEQNGMKYYFFIVPDKQTIYPEYLREPQRSWYVKPNYDVFSACAKKNNADFYIDIKPAIIKEKNSGKLVYYKTDSHWNKPAAFIAFTRLVKQIKKDFREISQINEEDFNIVKREYAGDMVSRLLHLGSYLPELSDTYEYKKKYSAKQKTYNKEFEGEPISKPLILSENTAVQTGTVLIIRDSQFKPIIPWISESFSRIIFINIWEKNQTIVNLLKKERPFIIIEERVERSIHALPTIDVSQFAHPNL